MKPRIFIDVKLAHFLYVLCFITYCLDRRIDLDDPHSKRLYMDFLESAEDYDISALGDEAECLFDYLKKELNFKENW